MNTSIKPLERPAGLADRVYNQLRDNIGSHQIRPGERLQEVGLAAQLGVSRTPVREALARLESEGMIVVEGRGFVVPELTDADIEEIYELRFLLEPAAAKSAVGEVGSAADLASMSAAIDDAVAAEKTGDFRAFLEANSRFHNAWRALIPNRRMSKLLDQYVGHVRFLRVLTLGDASARKAALSGMKKHPCRIQEARRASRRGCNDQASRSRTALPDRGHTPDRPRKGSGTQGLAPVSRHPAPCVVATELPDGEST
jgi:DNA-binding GntR family transcriptional regulator